MLQCSEQEGGRAVCMTDTVYIYYSAIIVRLYATDIAHALRNFLWDVGFDMINWLRCGARAHPAFGWCMLSLRRRFVTGAQSERERQVCDMHQTCLDSVVWGPAGISFQPGLTNCDSLCACRRLDW